MTVEGKVAVVTGATAVEGLGHSIARVFARQGARVVGNGRRANRGAKVERAIRDAGGDFTFVQGDVRRVDDCRRLVEAALDRHGRIDILINNAPTVGAHPFAASHEVTEDDWDACNETMLKGTFFCCRYALPAMQAQGGGVILNIASPVGLGAWTVYRAYGAAKAGVIHLSAGLAEEYRSDNVRVHAIIISGFRSDENVAVYDQMAAGLPPAEREALIRRMIERGRDPDDTAADLAQIAGDGAAWVSGDAIRVPGLVPLTAPTASYVPRSSPRPANLDASGRPRQA